MKPTIFLFTLIAASALALTPAERKVVQDARTQLRAGIVEYQAADKRAAEAEQHAAYADFQAAESATAAQTLQAQIDAYTKHAQALAAENAKMKPVYAECTKYWGLGAIGYGFKELIKHLLIAAIVIVVLLIGLYAASFAFPWIGVGLAAVVKVFHSGLTVCADVLKSLITHLTPKPKPAIVAVNS